MASRASRSIRLGNVVIGGGAPVVVQSMTNTDTRDSEATLAQIGRLKKRGCEICRVAVPDASACAQLPKITASAGMPIIADIHFDWRLAVGAIENGCAGVRINPGNIGKSRNLEKIAHCAGANGAVIRVGVNSGSLEKELLRKFGRPTPEAMAESALAHCRNLEKLGFDNLKVSLKSSSVADTVAAYRKMRALSDYPLHIGVTEAGTLLRGAIKSAVALGQLLADGIGDTIRISLTAPPEEEVTAAYELLRALGLRQHGPEIISCPTCGRTEIDIFGLAAEVEKALEGSAANLKVAVMGCPVNGPGEAREADIGLAGGRDKGIIFKKGKVIRSASGREGLMTAFLEELDSLLKEKGQEK